MDVLTIIQEIDLLVPNSFSPEQKVNWVNQTQRQLFRDYPITTSFKFQTEAGRANYPIPSDCQQDNIEKVAIGEQEYIFSSGGSQTFYIEDNELILNPAPTESREVSMRYKPSPADLTAGDLYGVPTFPEDFHELLVLGGAYRAAQRVQNYQLAGELENRYILLARDARKHITRPKQKSVHVVRGFR